jgi:hypothetical protein
VKLYKIIKSSLCAGQKYTMCDLRGHVFNSLDTISW